MGTDAFVNFVVEAWWARKSESGFFDVQFDSLELFAKLTAAVESKLAKAADKQSVRLILRVSSLSSYWAVGHHQRAS